MRFANQPQFRGVRRRALMALVVVAMMMALLPTAAFASNGRYGNNQRHHPQQNNQWQNNNKNWQDNMWRSERPRQDQPHYCSSLYKIRKGDTLSQIARRNHTTVRELVNLNNIRNPNRIYAGHVICLAR
jgi:Ni/Co efflux regulator RcnB